MLRTEVGWQLTDDAWLAQRVHRAPDFLVGHTRARGLGARELGGNRTSLGAFLFVAAAGELHVRSDAGERIVRAGQALRAPAAGTALVSTSPNVELVVVLDRSARGVDEAFGEVPLAGVEDPLRWLAALGPGWVDADRFATARAHVPEPDAQRLASLVASHIAVPERYPGVDDLAVALGRDERRTSAALGRYFRRYHASFGGWRSYLATIRVELALGALGTMPASRLAERLGYRRATSLYHALERRGFTARSR